MRFLPFHIHVNLLLVKVKFFLVVVFLRVLIHLGKHKDLRENKINQFPKGPYIKTISALSYHRQRNHGVCLQMLM